MTVKLLQYGLFVLAAAGLPAALLAGWLLPYWRYVNVLGIIAAAFVGQALLKREDVKGYGLMRAALFVHLASLIAISTILR